MKAQNFELIDYYNAEPEIVKGYPCKIYKDYKFFVYKRGPKRWYVAEVTTGRKFDLWDSSTMWEAIQRAVVKVNEHKDEFDEIIAMKRMDKDARNHRAE